MREMIDKVYEYPATDMGNIWVSIIEMSDPLVQSINALHVRNGPEYISSTNKTLPELMAYENMNMQGGCLIIRQYSCHCQMSK